MTPPTQLRIDKWLWVTRIFKTRSLAAAACRAGKVQIAGVEVKPSREVRVGEVIIARTDAFTRTVRVLGVTEKRVGAALAPGLVEDVAPPIDHRPPPSPLGGPVFHRPRGAGRPTKRDRRVMDLLRGHDSGG